MSRLIVTGGAGKLGRAVVRDLLEHGHDVFVWDRAAASQFPESHAAGGSLTVLPVELTDYGQVLDAMLGIEERHDGVDAVVHLAAVPAPGLLPDAATFDNNMTATYHVWQAARRAGIKRIVWASSETVLGLPFDVPPPYIPVDESYPPRPQSTYSLVKTLEETMAAHFCRWDPELTMVGLRFSNVMDPPDYAAFPSFDADPRARKWNLWGYIDARDGAQAVRLALEYDRPGVEIFIIANADTVMTRANADLVAEVFPDVEIRGDHGEHGTLLSIDKARRLLGYEPRHTWRNELSSPN